MSTGGKLAGSEEYLRGGRLNGGLMEAKWRLNGGLMEA